MVVFHLLCFLPINKEIGECLRLDGLARLRFDTARGEKGTDYFRPVDRRLTERKNGFSRIVAGYGPEYG
jgi:hypothetical protein